MNIKLVLRASFLAIIMTISFTAFSDLGLARGEDYANWMKTYKNYFGNRKLKQIIIPGSHDSGMYKAQDCTNYATDCNTITQTKDVYNQLKTGARFFDLRPVWHNGAFRTGHYSDTGFGLGIGIQGCDGGSLDSVLDNVRQFMEETTDELVILRFGEGGFFDMDKDEKGWTSELMKKLSETIYNKLNTYMIKLDTNEDLTAVLKNSTFNDLLVRGRVIVYIKDYKDKGRGFLDLSIYDDYAESNDLDSMVKDQLSKLTTESFHTENDMFLLSWTLTQGYDQLGLCGTGISDSILDLAGEANNVFDKIKERVLNYPLQEWLWPNIIFHDDVTTGATDLAIELNKKFCTKPFVIQTGTVGNGTINPKGPVKIGIGDNHKFSLEAKDGNYLAYVGIRDPVNPDVYARYTPVNEYTFKHECGTDNNRSIHAWFLPGTGPSDTLDSSFPSLANGSIDAAAFQLDGKIVVGGNFMEIGGKARRAIARIDANEVDSFSIFSDAMFSNPLSYKIKAVATLPDGKLLVAAMAAYNVPQSKKTVELYLTDSNGNVLKFHQFEGDEVSALAIQRDGKILVGGEFKVANRTNLLRYNPDLSIDESFSASANEIVRTIAVLPDGRILVGGNFTSLTANGSTFSLSKVVRLKEDGSIDASYNGFPASEGKGVDAIAVQPDGGIIVGGYFTYNNFISLDTPVELVHNLIRLNSGGDKLDNSFRPQVNGNVTSIALQADGKIVIVGLFNEVGTKYMRRIARLNQDGTIDETFVHPSMGEGATTDYVNSVTVLSDGSTLVGGIFLAVDSQARPGLARFNSTDPIFETLSIDASGNKINWMRSGPLPEFPEVIFMGSEDMEKWDTLGSGIRIPGGWEIPVPVPVKQNDTKVLYIKAQGRTYGGIYDASSSYMESNVIQFHKVSANSSLNGSISSPGVNYVFHGAQKSFQIAADKGFYIKQVNVTNMNCATGFCVNNGYKFDRKTVKLGDSLTVATEASYEFSEVNYNYSVAVIFEKIPFNLTSSVDANGSISPLGSSIAYLDENKSFQITAKRGFHIKDVLVENVTKNIAAVSVMSQLSNRMNVQLNDSVTVATAASYTFDHIDSSYKVSVVFEESLFTFTATAGSNGTISPVGTIVKKYQESQIFTIAPDTGYYVADLRVDGIPMGSLTNYTLSATKKHNIDVRFAPIQTAPITNPSYNLPTSGPLKGAIKTIVIQADDGKAIVGGNFTTLGGQNRMHLARINPNGTLDMQFSPNPDGTVFSAVVQPSDKKVIVGGDFITIYDQGRNSIARFSQDGILDADFNPDIKGGGVFAIAIQPDGKVIVGGDFTSIGNESRHRLARLNTDGTLDTTFNPDIDNTVRAIIVKPDGNIMIGGDFSVHLACLKQLDGTLDTSFNHYADAPVHSLAIQADGKILVGGDFSRFNGQEALYLVRINRNYSFDTSFDPKMKNAVYCIAILPDGKILVGGLFDSGLTRLKITGMVDEAFTSPSSSPAYAIAIQPDGKILSGSESGIYRLYPDGSLDGSDEGFGQGINSPVYSTVSLPDGTAVVGGAFPGGIARIAKGGGALDLSYYKHTNGVVRSLAVQTDGKLLVGGDFTTVDGLQGTSYLVRFNKDGTLDASFKPVINGAVLAIAVQTNGKILVGGEFSINFGRGIRSHFARLNQDGTLDSSIYINSITNTAIYAIAIQSDGKILLGGDKLDSEGRRNLVRINQNGRVDLQFTPLVSGVLNGNVHAIAIQKDDGMILLGGEFTQIGSDTRNRLARLSKDGTLDTDFNPNLDGTVYSIAIQTDGKITVGGDFTSIGGQPRYRLARFEKNGSIDSSFYLDANNVVNSIALQPDGKIIVGGAFTSLCGQPFNYLARIAGNGWASQRVSADTNGSRISWMRGGAGPEIIDAVFLYSSDGDNWTTIATTSGIEKSITSITGGWELTSLNLARNTGFYIKAQGRPSGGMHNAGTSLLESVQHVYLATTGVMAGNPFSTVPGDADGDRHITIGDAFLILKMATGQMAPLAKCDVAPLVDGVSQPDGKINSADALLILKKVVGLVNW